MKPNTQRNQNLSGALVHSYHRGIDGRVLFYCVRDRLVYYTLFMTLARERKIKVYSLTLMFNHTHSLTDPGTIQNLESFYALLAQRYSCAVNRYAGQKGPLFEPFKWAVKRGGKAIRSCIIYIANNSAEKNLVRHAEQDRWTFLAYADDTFPFSEPARLRFASRKYRKAIALVKAQHKAGLPLDYPYLNLVFKDLSPLETEQATDYIISLYRIGTTADASLFFEGEDAMMNAIHSNTGKEYDLAEVFESESDSAYAKMCHAVARYGYDLARRTFLQADQAITLLPLLQQATGAPQWQVCRFLHLSRGR